MAIAKKMSLWSRRWSPKSAPDREFRYASLSFSYRKLSRILGEIKSRRKNFSADRNIVVEFMENSSITSFPLFPVSSATQSTPSGFDPSTIDVSQSSLGSVSSPVSSGQLSARIKQDTLESKSIKSRFVTANYLRHVLTNVKCIQGAKLTMLALLVIGFLCLGKAAAFATTLAAYVIVRLGLRLGILDSSSSRPESAQSRGDVRPESSARQTSSNIWQDQQGLENRTQERHSLPQRRLPPTRNREHVSVSEEFKAACRPFLRSFTMPVARKGFSPIMNRVLTSGASDRVDTRSKSLTRLGNSLQGEFSSSTPVNPSTASGSDFASPLSLERSVSQEGVFPEHYSSNLLKETTALSRVCSRRESLMETDQVSAYLKLGTMLLVALCGLHHGRLTAVFMTSCAMLIFSKKALEFALPKKSLSK